ncbi:MAG: DUF479 domain-containing protein [Candidatus Latescibacteria bacterium]|jgi:acyl carrier protein phosphodiesterase|nr:DUF479 domain-containing protein [Candidatus Latescibacterota bacterium]
MNFLAHLYFADGTTESRLGNIMADFVKGTTATDGLGPAIVEGINKHRSVDRFTDAHETVKASKGLISSKRRRFAGIIVDVCYDHFLARNWPSFASTELPVFAQEVYTSFREYSGDLPVTMRQMLHYMIEQNWLVSYGTTSGIARALDGLSSRIRRENTLAGAVEELEEHHEEMERHFLAFFPDLMRHIDRSYSES